MIGAAEMVRAESWQGGRRLVQQSKKYVLSFALVVATVAGGGVYLLVSPHQTQYCWLAFGHETKLRILVRMDSYGNQISLTHFVDGQPTGRVDKFPHWLKCKDISIADPDGKTTYLLTKSGRTCTHQAGRPTEMFFHFNINSALQYKQYCDVVLMPCEPESARQAHFHGPLTLALRETGDTADLELKRGLEPTSLNAILGTFDTEKGCWVIVRLEDEKTRQPLYPKSIFPFVDVDFPAQDGRGTPIKRRYPLEEVRGGVLFHGAVPVPDEAAIGTAKVRFSLDRGKPGKVASSTVELPVVDSNPG